MPSFKCQLEALEFDEVSYFRALDRRMTGTLRTAARLFVRAALAQVPVVTGFAAGSLGNLALATGDQPPPLSPSARRPQYYYPRFGGRVQKTPANALAFATPVANVLLVNRGTEYAFQYRIDIDYYPRGDKTWQSFDAGSRAAAAYLASRVRRDVPRLADFFTRVVYEVTSQGVRVTRKPPRGR